MSTKELTKLALLTTIALILFTVEAQIPVPLPIPGVKLGLANVVTVYAAFTMGAGETLLILLGRILLGSIFTGTVVTMLYSLGGGLLCMAVTLLLTHVLSQDQIWMASVVGAVFHNLGQLLVAMVIMKSPAVFAYLPYLLLSGMVTGGFTGLAAQAAAKHLKKLRF